MPHCILDYSSNIADNPDFRALLCEINDFLSDSKLFNSADIKSRAVKHDLFIIGEGDPSRAFITLNVQMLKGRDDQIKSMLSKGVLSILESYFPHTLEHRLTSITVQISDIDPSYGKLVSY